MIDLGMLTRLLEDELELEVRSGTSRPLLRLGIQAFLLEAASLRSRISNLESEREKLRSDVAEANQRSAIMAQEIDDQGTNSTDILNPFLPHFWFQIWDFFLPGNINVQALHTHFLFKYPFGANFKVC